jgi:hypothetical protein
MIVKGQENKKDQRLLEYVEIGTGDPIESENLVEFRLLYSGLLLGASRNNTRASEKHELRRAFHPQLRRLWATNRNLIGLAEHWAPRYAVKHFGEGAPPIPHEDYKKLGIKAMSEEWERFGYHFVPLVTDQFTLRCKLDILFLRPEERRYVMQGGDLDARLKTVFDALRIPDTASEAGGIGPGEDETPFFCLLQDDKLITEVSVTTDQLLVLPKERDVKPNEAFLVIHVQINHANAGTFDRYF